MRKINKEVVKTNDSRFYVLACDPSLTAFGFSIINEVDDTIVEVGCIKTSPEQKRKRIRKSDDTLRRASELIQELLRVIRKYDVKYIVNESPHGSQNANAAVMIGLCAGIICTLSEALDIPLETYSENDSKKQVLGKNAATKKEMIEAIDKLYKVPWTKVGFRDEAIADSLAVYTVAKRQSQTLKLFRKNR